MVLGLIAYFYFNPLEAEKKGEKKYYWGENYDVSSKQPYGTYILSELLKNYLPQKDFRKIRTPLEFFLEEMIDSNQVNNYVFVGEDLYMNHEDEIALINFVAQGNKAFLIISEPDLWLNNSRFFYEEVLLGNSDYNTWEMEDKADSIDRLFSTIQTDEVKFNFYDPSQAVDVPYAYTYLERNTAQTHTWTHFQESLPIDVEIPIYPLGYLQPDTNTTLNEKRLNYVGIDYGLGVFYLHTTPIAFANINLLDSLHLEYAGKVFSHLADGDIFWDEYSKVSGTDGEGDRSKSQLSFILSQPALRWAWYLLLATILLYVLFRAKRRQRMIPVLAKRENTSMEYVKTIGTLYFQQGNHHKLAQQKMKQFLGFLHFRYRLPTKSIDEALIKRIIEKSQVDGKRVQAIFTQFEQINQQKSLSTNNLVQFHHTIAHFYENCK